MNILFITTSLPHRRSNGGEIASASFIDALSQGGHWVEVVGYRRLEDAQSSPPNFHSACDWPIETEFAGSRRFAWLGQSFLRSQPYIVTKFMSAAMTAAVRRLCREHAFDAVIFDHLQMGWLVNEPCLPRRRIGIAHNLEHALLASQASDAGSGKVKRFLLGRDAKLMRQFESDIVGRMDQVWVLTADEQEQFCKLSGRSRDVVRVLPLPGQRFFIKSPLPAPSVDVIILGSWLWEVNRRGLAWFIEQVAPLLPGHLSVSIGGKGSETVPNRFPNIRYAGYVPDPAEFLASGMAICIPTIMGAGIQLKSIEGLAIGRPVVSTQLGLRGLDVLPPYAQTCKDALDMARTLVTISDQAAVDASALARTWAENRHRAFYDAIEQALLTLP